MKEKCEFTDEEAREKIYLIFDGYERRKKDKTIFDREKTCETIIKTYYTYVDKPDFSQVLKNFKRKYVGNENKVEDVKTKEEQEGLSLVYEYIFKKDLNDISMINDITDIHEILYSKTPYPEFGREYRKEDLYLYGEGDSNKTGSVELSPYKYIVHAMNTLSREKFEPLLKDGIELHKKTDVDKLINYINKCVELKCDLVRIHPFKDGNGRSIRAFINLLFRLANIPPVYISNKEKEVYQKALNLATSDDNFKDEKNYKYIKEFYMYKICDSIMALDIKVEEKKYIDQDNPLKIRGKRK